MEFNLETNTNILIIPKNFLITNFEYFNGFDHFSDKNTIHLSDEYNDNDICLSLFTGTKLLVNKNEELKKYYDYYGCKLNINDFYWVSNVLNHFESFNLSINSDSQIKLIIKPKYKYKYIITEISIISENYRKSLICSDYINLYSIGDMGQRSLHEIRTDINILNGEKKESLQRSSYNLHDFLRTNYYKTIDIDDIRNIEFYDDFVLSIKNMYINPSPRRGISDNMLEEYIREMINSNNNGRTKYTKFIENILDNFPEKINIYIEIKYIE